MKHLLSSVLLLVSVGAASLLLSSCEAPEVPRRVAFRDADFQWTQRPGTGAITGRAYIEMKDNTVNVGDNSLVVLFPVNAYTTEFITRHYEGGENLDSSDDRINRYLREERADQNGHFSFHGLAPGEYYVGADVNWSHWYWNDDWTKTTVDHRQLIYERITVRNGETVRITRWNQCTDSVL